MYFLVRKITNFILTAISIHNKLLFIFILMSVYLFIIMSEFIVSSISNDILTIEIFDYICYFTMKLNLLLQ